MQKTICGQAIPGIWPTERTEVTYTTRSSATAETETKSGGLLPKVHTEVRGKALIRSSQTSCPNDDERRLERYHHHHPHHLHPPPFRVASAVSSRRASTTTK